MSSHINQLKNEDESELLGRAKRESLKYYNEVELPKTRRPSLSTFPNNNRYNCESQGPSKPIWYEGKEADGFYLAAGSTYIYPTNYPLREYQESIIKSALFNNTLVSLPTGLGKTFIAAVVMYNYYRWYPNGKIVFMAPTRPLVAQQIKACYNIMGLPIEDTTEMTGNLNVKDRITLWKEKRVFFLTPQVMVNDINSKSCPANKVKCLIVDEAHRAVKDYAYCQVVSLLEEHQVIYRMLALSATPGNDVNGVQQIIQNLKISLLEFRGEDALDVIKYTHKKSVQSIVVNLSINIQRVKGDFLQVYDKYAKRLREYNALNCNISTVTKFQILKASEKFRANPPRGLTPSLVGSIICDFSVCMSLAHALELLQTYGLRAFYSYLSEGGDKNKAAATRLRNDIDLSKILEKLNNMLSKNPGEEGYIWGHPKLYKLASVLSDHFKAAEDNGERTKAIIFCQYRIVVNEVFQVLTSMNSSIKPVMFIGQSSSSGKDKGMTQAKQLEIMKNFRQATYNCMIATCVAEEGLDIGEVDLIILMEAHKSPIRLVQRIGRTGRKRNGKCVVLVTEGREEYKFKEALAARKSYVSNILNAKSVRGKLYPDSPSMFPPGIKPTRQLLHIEVKEIHSPEKLASVSKQLGIRSHLVPEESPFLSSDAYKNVVKELGKNSVTFNKIPDSKFLFHRINDEKMSIDELLMKDNVFSNYNDWNLQLHESHEISHTENSEIMCGLLNRFYSFDINFFNFNNKTNKESKKRKRETEKMSGDDLEPLITRRGKRNRKEANKINYGMDIRHCIAAAVDKVKPLKEFNENEVIDLDASDTENKKNFSNNDKLIDELILSLEKELSLNRNQSQLSCQFENDIISSLDLYSGPKKKKSTTLFKSHELLMKNNTDIFSVLISELEKIKIEKSLKNLNCSDLKINDTIIIDIENNTPEKILLNEDTEKSCDSLVDLDDLLKEDDLKETVQQCDESHAKEKSVNIEVKINGCMIGQQSSHIQESIASRPATALIKDTDNYWESISDDFFDFNTFTPNSKRYLAASTPKIVKPILQSKISKDASLAGEIHSPIIKESGNYEWNLDDLFDNDENKDIKNNGNSQNDKSESVMLGITQMVSMIEKEKLARIQCIDLTESDSDVIVSQEEVKNEMSGKPISRNAQIDEFGLQKQNSKCSNEENSVNKNLLDEDEDLFISVLDIDTEPPKVDNEAKKIPCELNNFSGDIFASTIYQSKYFDDVKENINTENIVTVKNTSKSESGEKINDTMESDNILSDIEELFNDSYDENTKLSSQNIANLETHANSNQDSNHHHLNYKPDVPNDHQNILKEDENKCSQNKKPSDNYRANEENCNLLTVKNLAEDDTESTVKRTDLTFKNFISNKKKFISSNCKVGNVQNSIKASEVVTLAKQREGSVEEFENKKTSGNENQELNDEWWFDFDFPSNAPSNYKIPLKSDDIKSSVQRPQVTEKNTNKGNKIIKYLSNSSSQDVKQTKQGEIRWNIKYPKNSANVRQNFIANEVDQGSFREMNTENCEKKIHKQKSEEDELDNVSSDVLIKTTSSKIIGENYGNSDNKNQFNENIACNEKAESEDIRNSEILIERNDKQNGSANTVLDVVSTSKVGKKLKYDDVNNRNHEKKGNAEILRSEGKEQKDKMNFVQSEFSDEDESEIFRLYSSKKNGPKIRNEADIHLNPRKTENTIKNSNLINSSGTRKKISKSVKKKRRRIGCEFIEKEAEISDNDTSSGGDDSSGLDELDESFIDDEGISTDNIHAKYLQSTKSPVTGKFKIPMRINNDLNVYSQYECNDTEYINDSFCVDSEGSSNEENELSAIEIAERKLEEKKRKVKTNQIDEHPAKKRRRIKIISPDTSDSNKTEKYLDGTQLLNTSNENNKQLKPKLKKHFILTSDSDASDVSPLITTKQLKINSSHSKATSAQKSVKSSKNLLKFFLDASSSKTNSKPREDDDLERAIRESQQEFHNHKRTEEIEDEELQMAIELSKVDVQYLSQPSTSKCSNF